MNATVGNIGEIIIAAFLIVDGKIDVVHAWITGSIIGNLLLVLGRLLVGGLKNGVQQYDQEVVGMNAASLIVPRSASSFRRRSPLPAEAVPRPTPATRSSSRSRA